MLISALTEQGTIMGTALKAAAVRNEVMVNNLANADVPGYKTKEVVFEDSLIAALEDRERTGDLDVSGVQAAIRDVNGGQSYRIDENNVDVEMQMVDLYQNSVRYEAMINCALNNSRRLNLAVTGR